MGRTSTRPRVTLACTLTIGVSWPTSPRKFYFTPLLDASLAPDWLIRLKDWLAHNGYDVIVRPARTYSRRTTTETGEAIFYNEFKGNIGIALATQALAISSELDTVILVTGNGDFTALVQGLQRRGCRVVVVSSDRTPESTVSDELRRAADTFIEMETIHDDIRTEREVGP